MTDPIAPPSPLRSPPARLVQPEPPRLTKLPPPPKHLAAKARAHYSRIGKAAVERGTLTTVDLDLVVLAASQWHQLDLAETHIARVGMTVPSADGSPKANPSVAAADRARALLARLLDQLGLTPAARTRVRTAGAAVAPDDPALKYFAD